MSQRGESPERARDAAQAETYLRLLAEAELRRALACPRGLVERLPPTALLWAANAVGAMSGTAELAARSLGPATSRAGQIAAPWAASALKFLAPPARQARQVADRRLPAQLRQARRAAAALAPQVRQTAAALAPPAGRAGRTLAQAGWRARIAADRLGDRLTRPDKPGAPRPHVSLRRVHAAGEVLVAAGVIGQPAAQSVVQGFGRALVARGLVGGHYALHLDLTPDDSPVPPAGPILAAAINAPVDLVADGYQGRMQVLSLVLAPGAASLTTVSWLTEQPPGQPDDDPELAWHNHINRLAQNVNGHATDNRGGSYRLRMDAGGGAAGPWSDQFELSPAPPGGLEWLDITLVPGQDPIHVDLTAAAVGHGDAARQPASPAERAERIIDSASELLLDRYDPEADTEVDVAEIADLDGIAGLVLALRAVGALTAGSPALARLVTLIRRLRLPVPADLAGADAAGPVELPAAWLTTPPQVEGDEATDQASVASAMAVLPVVDGVRCVISGLINEADNDITTMLVAGWGWPWPGSMSDRLWQPFSCWARDDAGRWHRGGDGGYSSDDGMAQFEIELSPRVPPGTTSLEITLTGLSGQATATVPLTWVRMP